MGLIVQRHYKNLQDLSGPVAIDLPVPAHPNEAIWYDLSDVTDAVFSWAADGSEGQIVRGEGGVVGPFAAANPPRFLVSGSCDLQVLRSG